MPGEKIQMYDRTTENIKKMQINLQILVMTVKQPTEVSTMVYIVKIQSAVIPHFNPLLTTEILQKLWNMWRYWSRKTKVP